MAKVETQTERQGGRWTRSSQYTSPARGGTAVSISVTMVVVEVEVPIYALSHQYDDRPPAAPPPLLRASALSTDHYSP